MFGNHSRLPLLRKQEEEQSERVWQRYNPLARGGDSGRRAAGRGGGEAGRGPDDILHKDFLRKYVFFAKSRPPPKVRRHHYHLSHIKPVVYVHGAEPVCML